MARLVGVDKWLFFITVLLVVAGLVMVFSASAVMAQERYHSPYTFVGKQALWALGGVVMMVLLMKVDYKIYNTRGFIYTALGLGLALLLLAFKFTSHNTHRWIRFGDFFTFQPSEIAKPALVLFLAWFLQSRLNQMDDWKRTLLPAAAVPLVFIVLVSAQPDLGTALVLFGVTVMLLLLAGMAWKYLAVIVGAAVPALICMLVFVPWRLKRMQVFFHPDADPQGKGFHIHQSLIAVGTGGFTGRGYMEGVQKLFFLPEAHTDFIFANLAEETGFVGSMLLLMLFVGFGIRGLRAAFRSQDAFARLTAFGITATVLLQAFFNISVVLALLPTKGIPLPFISSGGTSVFFTLATVGILLNITKKVD